MAPEFPPQLVIFDSRFEDDKLKGKVYYVEAPIGHRLRVRWDAEREPENFRPVGGGVAYVFETDQLKDPLISHDSIPDNLGGLRYSWSAGLNEGIPWVMFVLILPSCHTLVAAEPVPARAKIFIDRLALFWMLKANDLGRTQVVCTLKTFEGSASSKLVELNRFCSGEGPPPDSSIQIEDRSPSTAKRVFISYSHDSDGHRERVLALSERLRADGIETLLDQYVNGSPPQGWPRWMLDQLDAADSVLVVCTEAYYRRFRGHEVPGKGKGVDWEGALITQELYDSRSRTLKFVPVFLSAAVEDWIPEPLRAGNHYALISDDAYQRLYDFLLGQAGVEPRPVGERKATGRRKGTPLEFAQPFSSGIPPSTSITLSKEEVAPSIGRPRVYLSYTWRTKGLNARALKLAERLRKAGIDSRIDFFYAKSLHGFTPPDTLPGRDAWDAWQEEQIREAGSVLMICTPEYVASDPDTGAWRDMKYMQKDLKSGRAELRKFIPVGFGSYATTSAFIPGFIKGANYYDLTAGGLSGFGFDDLVRRLKAELTQEGGGAPQKVKTAEPTHSQASNAQTSPFALWQKKLDFLQKQEAIASDPAQKFTLAEQIEEAKAKIKELGG